jgi:putative ABC transport system substrate-binding protein
MLAWHRRRQRKWFTIPHRFRVLSFKHQKPTQALGDSMRRREFIRFFGCAAAIWSMPLHAQQVPTVVIGILHASSEQVSFRQLRAFKAALQQLGYIEGSNIRFVHRFADGFLDRLPDLAAELVQLNPSLIVSAPVPANLAARNATTTIPIVMADGADPVGFGLVHSLSHPGGNVTGLTNFAEDLAAKQLDIVRELLPHLARVAVLINITNPLHVPQWRQIQSAAKRAMLTLIPFEIRSSEQLREAFTTFTKGQAEALLIPPDVTLNTYGRRIAELATTARLPTIFFRRELVEDGGLMSYGPNLLENYRRAAFFVDRILKGAKPGDLPVERSTKFELVINLKTAKALGLEIPQPLLARAEDVIE